MIIGVSDPRPFSEYLILYYFTVIPVFFMISSIISFIMALNSIIKRYRVALGIVFANVLLLFCLALNKFVKHDLGWSPYHPLFLSRFFKKHYGPDIIYNSYIQFLYDFFYFLMREWHIYAVCLLFLIAGMYLFEKYAEA